MKTYRYAAVLAILPMAASLLAQTELLMNSFLSLMTKAHAHATAHGARHTPVLSPNDATLLGATPAVDVAELHRAGFRVVPWTTNDPAKMRALMALRVDGIISDRPDILQAVLEEERAAHPADAAYFSTFDVAAHRGGRGLRPENTLPSFESGLDQLATTLETDTGVTTDGVSLIWHDQFLNPQSCRRADGALYTHDNKVYTRDLSSAEAQMTFICDKLHFGTEQKNDLSLSPVAVAFAQQEHLISPYVPTYVEQLFHFVAFYRHYYKDGPGKSYKDGPGKSHPDAEVRWRNAQTVRFNLETKILPDLSPAMAKAAGEPDGNHTVDAQTFVKVLCGAILRNHMESRAEVQSFDFRTLVLVEEQFPAIPTYYLTGDPRTLNSELVPAALRP